jgi:hypothetical protein
LSVFHPRRLRLQKPAPMIWSQCRMSMPPGIRTLLGGPILFPASIALHVLPCQPRTHPFRSYDYSCSTCMPFSSSPLPLVRLRSPTRILSLLSHLRSVRLETCTLVDSPALFSHQVFLFLEAVGKKVGAAIAGSPCIPSTCQIP